MSFAFISSLENGTTCTQEFWPNLDSQSIYILAWNSPPIVLHFWAHCGLIRGTHLAALADHHRITVVPGYDRDGDSKKMLISKQLVDSFESHMVETKCPDICLDVFLCNCQPIHQFCAFPFSPFRWCCTGLHAITADLKISTAKFLPSQRPITHDWQIKYGSLFIRVHPYPSY